MNIEESIADEIHPGIDASGNDKPVLLQHDTALILEEILKTLRRINAPWMSTCEAAAYLGVSPSLINRWKNDGILPPYYGPGMGHPRYKRQDIDALLQRRKNVIANSIR